MTTTIIQGRNSTALAGRLYSTAAAAGRLSALLLVVFLTAVFRPAAPLAGPGPTTGSNEDTFARRLVAAAWQRTRTTVRYDPAYYRIAYPMGDPPAHVGVCSDVVIRAYRQVGIDLQRAVHEDMRRAFAAYPKHWGLRRPDANIDHRRVPNLRVFFKRHGTVLPVSQRASAYRPGDLVTWNLRGRHGNLPHIGIVVDKRSADGARPLIVHNIGAGPVAEDMLFRYPITGHYRYRPKTP